MFTAKHYIGIAEVIHQQRLTARVEQDADVRLQTISNCTLALVKLFEQDNPKFNRWKFIEAAHRDLA